MLCCDSCGCPPSEHTTDGKCLFKPTRWVRRTPGASCLGPDDMEVLRWTCPYCQHRNTTPTLEPNYSQHYKAVVTDCAACKRVMRVVRR